MVVGDAVALSEATAEQQHHGEHDDSRERSFATLFDRAEHKLGILEPTVLVERKGKLKKVALGIREHKRCAGFGIDQHCLDE